MIIITNYKHFWMNKINNIIFDKYFRWQTCKFFCEFNDYKMVNSGFFNALKLVFFSFNKFQVGIIDIKHNAWVWRKSNYYSFTIYFFCLLLHLFKDSLMTQVNTIKRTNRNNGVFNRLKIFYAIICFQLCFSF